jgi:hypothetical protein
MGLVDTLVEELELTLRIILEKPPAGVDFGLQKGGGNDYEVVQTQRSGTSDLRFDFTVRVKTAKDGSPNFLGPFVHGPVGERFVYIDVGTAAGQRDSLWTRRIKIPLRGIEWDAIKSGNRLEAQIPGTGKDGTPTCATVKPFSGWH